MEKEVKITKPEVGTEPLVVKQIKVIEITVEETNA
jgi:hypothetical protein